MKITEWYDSSKLKNKNIRGEVKLLPGGVEIALSEIHSVGVVSCDVEDFTPGRYIRAEMKLYLSGTVKSEVFATWYKNGESIFEEYIFDMEKIIPFEGADKLRISAMVYGSGGGYAKISNVTVSEGECIPERKAKVAGLSIPYGFVWEHKLRTCEDNIRDSLERIDALMKEEKVDLVVLTETFNSRITSVEYDETFITLEGEEMARMKSKAKEHGIYLAFSLRERTAEGGVANSAVLIDRQGEIVSYYRKCHLTLSEKLSGLTPGNEIVVCDTDFGRVGFAICWDLYYPETARMLVKQGAELIINPTAGFEINMHTQRAKDAGVFVVTGGVWGSNCTVIAPDGNVLAEGSMMGAAIAEIDFNKRYPVQYLSVNGWGERRNVYYREMREDLY